MPLYALPYHIGVWKGMEGHREGNGHKLEEGQCQRFRFRKTKIDLLSDLISGLIQPVLPSGNWELGAQTCPTLVIEVAFEKANFDGLHQTHPWHCRRRDHRFGLGFVVVIILIIIVVIIVINVVIIIIIVVIIAFHEDWSWVGVGVLDAPAPKSGFLI